MKYSPSELLKKINEAKKMLHSNDIFKDMCKEYGQTEYVIDLIPIRFGDIDVAAKTVRGIIILNKELLSSDEGFEKHIHYILHEISHHLQMITRSKPTKGSDEGEYLENEDEIEAFTYQVEFMDDMFGSPKAENYVDNLLDHHDVEDKKERDKKKDELMERIDE
jgi:hypothetical protein